MNPPPDNEPKYEQPTYEGARFPWWMWAYWIAFHVFLVVYLIIWMFPDLKLWLLDATGQIWK